MRVIRKCVGKLDKYNRGTVKHIDFTYRDHVVVWVEYAKVCLAYLAVNCY